LTNGVNGAASAVKAASAGELLREAKRLRARGEKVRLELDD